MTYQIPKVDSLPWLQGRTILYVVHGSRAYGTSRPDSDYDYKGVAVAPVEYRDGFVRVFEQAIIKEPDATVFDLRKFMRLAADCNPNIIEVLWVADEDRLLCTEAGQKLVDAREQFLSRKAKFTFSGYAMSQLKRIRTHHKWLLDPPKAPPTRAEYGLPERTVIPADQLGAAQAAIKEKMDSWGLDMSGLDDALRIHVLGQVQKYLEDLSIGTGDQYRAAGRLLGYEDNFLDLLERERRYKAASDNWRSYQNWKESRNEARAELEAKYGYDTKHGMHLVRLMRMCREILTEGLVRTRRPDAKELLDIRNGAWTYDKLIGWAEDQEAELNDLVNTSPLPRTPNRNALDDLCMEIHAMLPPR